MQSERLSLCNKCFYETFRICKIEIKIHFPLMSAKKANPFVWDYTWITSVKSTVGGLIPSISCSFCLFPGMSRFFSTEAANCWMEC